MKSVLKQFIAIAFFALSLLTCHPDSAQHIEFIGKPELFMPGMVSTENGDVKITFSADGNTLLWGGIDWIKGRKDLDIWQSDRVGGKWSKPIRASFDTDSNDFDPFFSPDGKGVYFFSNRAGGFGGDDIYFSAYNPNSNKFTKAVNVGNVINTQGNEWAPVTDGAAGLLIFSSNGRGGYGKQDLFSAKILPDGFSKPKNLGPAINTTDDDFDAILLPEGTIVFTSIHNKKGKADLYFAYRKNSGYAEAKAFPSYLSSKEFWTFGPSVNFEEPGYLYFSSHLTDVVGRTDIYRIRYRVK